MWGLVRGSYRGGEAVVRVVRGSRVVAVKKIARWTVMKVWAVLELLKASGQVDERFGG